MRKLPFVLVILFGLLVTCHAKADHYRAGDLEKLMAVPNWELVRHDIDIVTGSDFGAPILVHRYQTLAACDAAQKGRLSRPHNIGTKWVVGRYTCRHKDAEVI